MRSRSRLKKLAAALLLLLLLLVLFLGRGGGGSATQGTASAMGQSGSTVAGGTPRSAPETTRGSSSTGSEMGNPLPTTGGPTSTNATPTLDQGTNPTPMTETAASTPQVSEAMELGQMAAPQNSMMLDRSALGLGDKGESGAAGGGLVRANTRFFGLMASGSRILYIVDVSGSMMQEQKLPRMREQLTQSISDLPDNVAVCVIFFNSKAFLAGDLPDSSLGGTGTRLNLPLRWSVTSTPERQRLVNAINLTPAGGGTDWRPPFQMAAALNPAPEAIYFLTDGIMSRADEFVPEILSWQRALRTRIPVHTIGYRSPPDARDYLQSISSSTGGQMIEVH